MVSITLSAFCFAAAMWGARIAVTCLTLSFQSKISSPARSASRRTASGHAWSQRQNGLRAVQRLYLALFIHAQDHRAIRRIHIEPNDIPHLFDKLRIFGKLEVLHSMRLQPESMPNPHNGGLR